MLHSSTAMASGAPDRSPNQWSRSPKNVGPSARGGDSWRNVFAPDCIGLNVTSIHQKTWTGLSAVLRDITVCEPFELETTAPYTRLLVVLEEVGGRFHSRAPSARQIAKLDMPHLLYFVPAGAEVWEYADKLRYCRHISLQFSKTALAALIEDDFEPKLPDAPQMGFQNSRLFTLARLFETECAFEGGADPLLGDGLSISLLALLMGLETSDLNSAHSGGLPPWKLKAVIDYLECHLSQAVDPKQLAKLAGLSASHFYRAFKASMGKPPHAWLTELRIRRARELLLLSDSSLADIALATGFSDQPHFTRVFSRQIGCSPGTWRRTATGTVSNVCQ